MYCPSCGSPNKDKVKFCTRCGANLLAVARALTETVPVNDDRVARVLSEYYRGRRDTITGIVLIPSGVKALAFLLLLGMPLVPSLFFVSWMMFWGIWALAVGLGKWSSAKGELRALGYTPPASKLALRLQALLSSGSKTADDRAIDGNRLEPAAIPASVTESTTNHLDTPSKNTTQQT